MFKRAFQRLYGPVDPRNPEAYHAWRRLLTPIMFFRCVSDDGVAAWLHNVACRPLLAHGAIVRVPLTYACFWLGALTAPWSAVASLPFWIIWSLTPPPASPFQTGFAAWRLAARPDGRLPQRCTSFSRFTDRASRRR